jgi:hypothetical protein
MGSKQSGTQTVQQKADPWAGAQPYLTGGYLAPMGGNTPVVSGVSSAFDLSRSTGGGVSNAFDRNRTKNLPAVMPAMPVGPRAVGILPEAERLYNQSNATPFNADELAGMEAMRSRGNRDYGLINTGLNTLNSAARGDFLPQSGYLDSVVRGDYLGQQNFMDAYGEGILNDVNSRFAKANRTGSGYAAQSAAKGLTQAAAPLYAQERALQQQAGLAQQEALMQGRQMQQQAAMATPGFQSAQYGLLDTDTQALLQAGAMQRNRPYENLQNYANIVLPSANQGGSSSTATPLYSNPAAGALGGALGGFMMGGPFGALLGGGLGLLGG